MREFYIQFIKNKAKVWPSVHYSQPQHSKQDFFTWATFLREQRIVCIQITLERCYDSNFFLRNIEMITWISFNIRTSTFKSCNISEIYSHLRQTQTWICATWLRFPLTCLKLLFTFKSSYKLFSSIKIVRRFFICSFSILRNSQPESAVCRLP